MHRAVSSKGRAFTAGSLPFPADAAPPLLARDVEAHLRACIERVVLRDATALEELYDATVHRVYSVALRILMNEEAAEEVVSDAFFQAWREAHRYDPSRGPVTTWLLIICRTRALDALRRRDPSVLHPDPETLAANDLDDRGDLQDILEATQRRAGVHAALRRVSPIRRQLLALAFFRALTHSEIAVHLGMPLGSVKTQIRQALRELRVVLGEP
ncbi:MAG: sigma-70 family RNA polymerase sigma factor [Pseudomonadota bacterium]|nr:sigma-70 family RNA polymerase sigma factor [Pseudomonadota bacterium]